jgi:hypothetical protein
MAGGPISDDRYGDTPRHGAGHGITCPAERTGSTQQISA